MFLFLKDEQGLRGFLDHTPLVNTNSSWHNLLTLDVLFDYFHDSGLHAGDLIADAAKLVQGGGGKAPDLAVAGGKRPEGLDQALAVARRAAGLALG